MSRRRVVITGLGTVNPLSDEVTATWKGLLAGKNGIGSLEQFDCSLFKVQFGGEVKNWDGEKYLDPKVARRIDRFAQFALVSSIAAARDCGIDFAKEDPYRCGCIIGSGIGGLKEWEEQHKVYLTKGPTRINPFVIPRMICNAASGHVSIHFNLCGPNSSVVTACASAAHSINDALRAIQHDQADVMLAGGSEATITPMGLGGFIAARALSTRTDDPQRASRPFDKDRDGFVLSEGAGMVVLEELEHAKKRGAPIYAELLGSGCTADAHHITAPHPDGLGAAKAMEYALRDAHVNPDEVQYVNAHGTSTQLGDEAETKAIKNVFRDHARKLMVSSTKSMLGHTLGASGAIELMVVVLTIKHSIVHPTINYQTPDPVCDLDYVPNTAREVRVKRAISNSFGFGGHNACLVVGALN